MLRKADPVRLTVTDQTSLEQLQGFANKAGDNAKIRGKINKDNSVTLYASTKKGTGLDNTVQGDRGGKQAAARFAVTMVLNQVKGANLDTAMAHVKSQLPAQGELRGSVLSHLVNQALAARRNAVDAPRDLPELGAALHAALVKGNVEAVKHLTAELGKSFGDYMRGKSRDAQMEFAISRGDAFKGQMLGALAMQLPDPQPLLDSYKQDGPMRAVLDQAYQQAATQLTDHQNGDGTLEIGGKTYAKDRHLAAGGFGSVDVYKAKDGEEIAVKTPIVNDPGDRAAKFEEAASEVRAHSSAVAGNPANVIGLKGVVRTPDGGIQIALELAPRGNAQDAIDKLNTAARRGQITPQEANLARLTILKDMIQGLHHVQETRGMTHLDIKGPNFFVDASGVTKLGDFGTARAGARQQLESNPIQNPRWAAPELVKGDSDRRSQVNAIHEQADAAFGAAAEKLKATLPSDALEVALSDTKKTLRAERDHKTAAVPLINVTSKVDTWSIGVELYKAFTNKLPFDSDSSFPVSDIQEAQKAFTDRGAKLRLPPEKNLFGLERTQFGQLNTLVGELMHPDPQQRPTLTQALQNPLFQLPGVGGAQARAIIQQVTT